MRSLILSLAPLAALSACHDPNMVIGQLDNTIVLPALPNRDLDLLFVIDDSPSMAQKQAALAAAFPQMIDVLSQLDGGLPNLHIGVVSSDMGTSSATTVPGPAIGQIGQGGCSGNGKDGVLQIVPGSTTDGASFLVDTEGAGGVRERNYTGALRDAFAANAQVGAGGCGFEQHLSAMSRALDNPTNAGFLRPGANLAVVILADEDDCSFQDSAVIGPDSAALGALQSFRCFRFGVTCDEDSNTVGDKHHCEGSDDSPYIQPVGPFIDRLVAIKGDERRVMVGVIAGEPSPVAVELRPPPSGTAIPALAHSCTISYPNELTSADPAVRLRALVDAFPGRSTFTSICSTDLASPLHAVGSSAKALMGDPCLDSSQLADIEPALPGIQPSCEVLDVADHAPDLTTSLAECSSGAQDCYEIVADAAACPATEDHLRVRLTRATTVTPDTWTHVRCKRSE